MKRLILFILLIASFDAFGAPPPISTFPLTVTQATPHAVGPTGYTDGIISDAMSALNVLHNVYLVATTNVTLSGVQSIDGFSTSGTNGIVLLTNQGSTTAINNGPWKVNDSGAWTRPDWYKNGSTTQAIEDSVIWVRSGALRAGSFYGLNTASPITIGTTPTSWLVRPINITTMNGTLAAGQFPALTGDVTNTVGTLATTITNAAVTYAKIQNVAGLSVIGRSANSSGVAGAITGTNGQVLQVTGSTLGFGPFVTPTITPYPTPTPYPSATIYPTPTPAPSATVYPTTTPFTITLTGDVTGSGTGSIATTIANDAVTTAKILDSNVTLAKIANIPDGTILGNNSGGFGPPLFLNSGQARLVLDVPQTTRLISTTAPLAGGGDLSADRTLSIANAAADGTTRGAASFTAADFNASSGNISIDYTNGQTASASLKGFLSAADWTRFNTTPSPTPYPTTTPFPTTTPYPTPTPGWTGGNAAAHTVFGNFTASSALPSFNVLGTGVDAFLANPTSALLRTAVATTSTGTAGSLVFSVGPSLTGATTTQAITAAGLVDVTAGGFRAAGNGLGFTAGAGVELVYSEPRGYLQTYLRPSGPYKQFAIEGVATMLNPNSGGTAGAGGFGPTNTPLNVFHIVGSPANNTALGLATTAPNLRIGATSLANYWDIGRENAVTGDFVFNDATNEVARFTTSTRRLGVGTGATVSARIHAISTTEQLRLGFDASNYYSTTVSSTGGVTFDAVGTGAGFTFNDPVALTTGPSASPTPQPGKGILSVGADGALRYTSPSDGVGGSHTATLANQ